MTKPATSQPDDASALLRDARELSDLAEYAAAESLASKALAVDGANPAARVTRGWALENLGRDEEAAADYRAALETDPESMAAREGLGNVLHRLGEWDAAAALFAGVAEAAGAADDPDAEMLELAGWCLFRLERHDEAAHSFRTALTLDPSRAAARFDLALTLLCGGHGRRGLAEYERSVRELAHWEPAARRGTLTVARFDLREEMRERTGLAEDARAVLSLELLETALREAEGV